MRLVQLFPLALLALAACSTKSDDDDDDDDDGGGDSGIWGDAGAGAGAGAGGDPGGGTGEPCDTAITADHPRDGQSNFYHRSPLVVELSAATGDEVLTLSDGDGGAVSGSNANDGTTLTFTPDAPLSPSSRYFAGVTLCGSELAEYEFSTSELGTPTDGCSVTGRTYQVDLVGARFIAPVSIAELLMGQVGDELVFSATSQTSGSIEWMSGGGAEGVQDECVETVSWPRSSWSDPHFRLGPEDAELHLAGLDVVVSDLAFAATLGSDCASYGGGMLTGEIDARVVAPLLVDLLGISDPDEFCATMTGFGVTCLPCGADGEPYCIPLDIRDVSATATSGAIEEISAADVAGNSSCP
jgi:hypothetical protein